MRIQTSCPACFAAAVERRAPPNEVRAITANRVTTSFTHARFGASTCKEGHQYSVILNEPAFALVFERGLQRFVDGDHRDAVIDVYTALDMYLATVPVRAWYDRDPNLTPADIPALRKALKFATSEANKALGAALAVVAVHTRKAPPKFETDLASLRNRAVHAGEYPTSSDTHWAIGEVERLITTIDEMLTEATPDRDPPFRFALSVADFPSMPTQSARGSLVVSLQTVLGGGSTPRETVQRRLERYREGELDNVRLF